MRRWRISLGLRLFTTLLLMLVAFAWITLDRAAEHIKRGTRQAVETTLVDIAQLLAAQLSADYAASGDIDSAALAWAIAQVHQAPLTATIYEHEKKAFELEVIVTDAAGVVRYDSSGKHQGEDFSQWRDVYLSLKGEYGARISYIDAAHQQEGDPRQMVIAAPIIHQQQIVGVVSVAQPLAAHDFFSVNAALALRYAVLTYLLVALLLVLVMAWWLSRSLGKLSHYAQAMAAGVISQPPHFSDPHFERLRQAIEHLRSELDGKSYVEHYIHGLTHELKTPLTNVIAAAEFLAEADLRVDEQAHFTARIQSNAARLQALVERILHLAQLENRQQLAHHEPVALHTLCDDLLAERQARIDAQQWRLKGLPLAEAFVCGDRLLIRQALANLIDNAFDFTPDSGAIRLALETETQWLRWSIHNQGAPIPDYAQQRLFERFFSLPRPQTRQRSSGLGLSFVAQIMALHGGRVEIANHEDGVLAVLYFPRAPSHNLH